MMLGYDSWHCGQDDWDAIRELSREMGVTSIVCDGEEMMLDGATPPPFTGKTRRVIMRGTIVMPRELTEKRRSPFWKRVKNLVTKDTPDA